MSGQRTRENTAPLNARVTLELANRLRQHLDHRHGEMSRFVQAAVEEKLARELQAGEQKADGSLLQRA